MWSMVHILWFEKLMIVRPYRISTHSRMYLSTSFAGHHSIRWPRCWRRESVLSVGGWNERQSACQEHELIFRLLMAGRKFELFNTAVSVVRHHEHPSVSRRNPELTIRLRMALTDRAEVFLADTGRLTPAHMNALYTARMQAARHVFRFNADLAKKCAAKATRYGYKWVHGEPALPRLYQLINRFCGFVCAEQMAATTRKLRTAALGALE